MLNNADYTLKCWSWAALALNCVNRLIFNSLKSNLSVTPVDQENKEMYFYLCDGASSGTIRDALGCWVLAASPERVVRGPRHRTRARTHFFCGIHGPWHHVSFLYRSPAYPEARTYFSLVATTAYCHLSASRVHTTRLRGSRPHPPQSSRSPPPVCSSPPRPQRTCLVVGWKNFHPTLTTDYKY